MDIYPARETPIEGITSAWLLEQIENDYKRLVSKHDLIDSIRSEYADVVVMMGAGDIGDEVESVQKALQNGA